MNRKPPEFLEKSPLPRAEKHHNFGATPCLQNVSINIDFACAESEIMPFFRRNINISHEFFASVGLSKR